MTKKPAITHKITTHLWFDKEAREAAEFYTGLFPKSKIKSTTTLNNTPSGTVEVVTIDLHRAGRSTSRSSVRLYCRYKIRTTQAA